jgi:DNA-directed RNA polymerase subunit K/omega
MEVKSAIPFQIEIKIKKQSSKFQTSGTYAKRAKQATKKMPWLACVF